MVSQASSKNKSKWQAISGEVAGQFARLRAQMLNCKHFTDSGRHAATLRLKSTDKLQTTLVVEKIAEPVPLRNAPIVSIDGALAPTFHIAIHFNICQQQERGITKWESMPRGAQKGRGRERGNDSI